MGDRDDRRHLEEGAEKPVGPGSTGGTAGESHGEDLGMHLEHDAEGDAEERRRPESDRADNAPDDVVPPFDKESRLSDVDPDEQPTG